MLRAEKVELKIIKTKFVKVDRNYGIPMFRRRVIKTPAPGEISVA